MLVKYTNSSSPKHYNVNVMNNMGLEKKHSTEHATMPHYVTVQAVRSGNDKHDTADWHPTVGSSADTWGDYRTVHDVSD